ncbi:MAG: HDOD domain-containing protein [Dehalococcoidia bacterium]
MTTDFREAAISIPPLAASCTELLAIAIDEGVDVRQVSHVAERDGRVALELLRLANSAYFVRYSRVTTVKEAVVRLGTTEALRASIAVAMTALFADRHSCLSDAETIDTCRKLARAWASAGRESDGTAGLLMPLGLLVLQQYRPAAFAELAAHAEQTADFRELHAVERRAFGLTRCEALTEAAQTWSLPLALTETLARWHVCGGVSTPYYVATAMAASTLESPFFGCVAVR